MQRNQSFCRQAVKLYTVSSQNANDFVQIQCSIFQVHCDIGKDLAVLEFDNVFHQQCLKNWFNSVPF